ncbi:hypothetical protein B7P43_G04744 [Cryptotermes secundus]|uniref:Uncharacterized protein n=1 Tax=Cryptotermes secundus TaxID=105785 RepID=A0A2J7QNB9_9NEOP|nr:hypothetical protein B7P43_G04744 [Cryptotermes secundus]
MDIGFGTWNVRNLYRAGSLMTVGKETSKYKFYFRGVQEVRWDRGAPNQQVTIHFTKELPKKREYLKNKINELATEINYKNTRDAYKGLNEFRRGYEHSQKSKIGDLLAYSHNILKKRWEYNETVPQLLIDFKKAYDSVFFIASLVGLNPLYCGHFWPIVPAPDGQLAARVQCLYKTATKQEKSFVCWNKLDVRLLYQCNGHSKESTQKNRHVNKAFCGGIGNVRRYLNNELQHRWIGRVGEDDVALFTWPLRSPDLTPCDFFLWGYIKDRVYVPPLPRTLVELRERIDAAVMTIDRMMLQNTWNELDYRLDVCRVTQGAHIEHL